MVPAYATSNDLAQDPWNITPAPTAVGVLLRVAARLIRAATVTAVYATNDDGAPTDPSVIDAFRDASCTQVAAWITAGVDPTAPLDAASGRVAASKSLGGGSITYADTALVLAEREQLRTSLTSEAVAILADAGLTRQRPEVYG